MTTELPTAGTPIYVDADADALSYLFQYQTESAVLRLIEDRPPLWRFILFAVELTNGLRAVEHSSRTKTRPGKTYLLQDLASLSDEKFSRLGEILEELGFIFGPGVEKVVIGKPGKDANPEKIRRMAVRAIVAYQDLVDWPETFRTMQFPPEASRLQELGSSLLDNQIDEIRGFMERLAFEIGKRLVALQNGALDLEDLEVCMNLSDNVEALNRYESEVFRLLEA